MALEGTTGGAYVYAPGDAERRWMDETFSDFLATGDLTGEAYALIDERAHRSEQVPLHVHAADFESFFVLEGEVTFFLGERAVRVGSGGFVHVSGGLAHGFRVESDAARYLIVTTPNHGRFWREISDTEPGGAWDWERIGRACETYGVSIVEEPPVAG